MKDIKIAVFGNEVRALEQLLELSKPMPHELRHASKNPSVEAWLVVSELLDRIDGAIRIEPAPIAPEPVTDRPTLRMRRPTPQTIGDWPEMQCTCPPAGFGQHDADCPMG